MRRLVLTLLVLCLTGCGAKRHPVSGVVTLDGKTIEGAAITFVPDDGGPLGEARTDAEGRFSLRAGKEVGLLTGGYKVLISKEVYSNVGPDEVPGPGGLKQTSIIPKHYADKDNSGLTATVPSETYDFHLKSK